MALGRFLHIRIGHARICSLDRTNAQHATVVPRLLLELAHGSLLGRLVGVDETRGPLDRVRVQRGPVLDDDERGRRARGVQEHVANGHGVDAGLTPRLAGRDLPRAVLARLVGVLELLERDPSGFGGGQLCHLVDDWFLGLLRHAEGSAAAQAGWVGGKLWSPKEEALGGQWGTE